MEYPLPHYEAHLARAALHASRTMKPGQDPVAIIEQYIADMAHDLGVKLRAGDFTLIERDARAIWDAYERTMALHNQPHTNDRETES